MRRKLTQRGRDRREQLIACAARLFAERGYHPTSVSDIVEALGVGKGVFYWYFSSKEELLAELLKASNHSLRKRQQQAIGDEPDPVRRIELGIRATLTWFRCAPRVLRDHRLRRDRRDVRAGAAPQPRDRDRRHDPSPQGRHRRRPRSSTRIRRCSRTAIHGVVSELTRHYLVERSDPLSPDLSEQDPARVDRVADLAVTFCLRGLTR